MSNTVNDLFNPTGAVETTQRNTDIYKVSFKDGKNGVYNSVIRFIPFYANPAKNIMKKYTSWVKNPITQKGMYVDDAREVGHPSPAVELYFELNNTKIASYQDLAKNYLSSKLNYASLVQIIKDEQHPELEGKIKVFVFGKTIWEKLHLEEFPQIPGQTGINPFHPFYGRYFAISCTNKSNYNNFDNSQFFDNKDPQGNILPSGIWYLNPDTGQMAVASDGMNPQHLVDYLSTNSPDLSKYGFQAWTDEQTKHVNETCAIIRNFMSTGQFQSVAQGTSQVAMGVLGGTPQPSAIFPGATVPPTPATAPAVPQMAVPQAPVAQPAIPHPTTGFVPGQPTTGFVPGQPSAQPAAGFVPGQPTTGFVPGQPAAPSVGASPVTPPVVAPSVPAPQASAPASSAVAGVNVDDILKQL